ncbi:Phosphatidylinositol transfer protein (PITP) [Conoideocrella luteorostrata]|uniref:Phosphatidylinositol transfer protein (PITP) n=1 Tax=Conoideocrella luteorostrata TaxID=1105319 RepID=A0AAJ0G138_9HYPO|nr:Phosphatidylinositol transfer protein (PITP) [Conoideocrella luteorostrata]
MSGTQEATKASAPRKTPLEQPTPSSIPEPRAELTADQQTKYAALLEKVQSVTQITCPSKDKKAKSGPITDRERAWLTRECLLRYLRATNWTVKESEQRLHDTLAWRREYGIDEFTPEYVSPEQETGKQFIVGFDKQGRPCQYLNPAQQNTDTGPRQLHHLFYMMERSLNMMPPGVEKLVLMVNFKPSKDRQNTSVPVGTAREVLHILQSHYPERLGKALIINVPWLVWGFFKIIKPFMHPVTSEKLKFNDDMTQFVPTEQLWSTDWNGSMDFEYDHSVYWPALNEMCRQRREQSMARWTAAGSLIGESEDYLAGGTDVSVSGFTFSASSDAAATAVATPIVAAEDANTAPAAGANGNDAGDVDVVQEKLAAATLGDGQDKAGQVTTTY